LPASAQEAAEVDEGALMHVYHRTALAGEIFATGFQESELSSPVPVSPGIWVSDVPLSFQDGARGWTVLVLDLPEAEIAQYEVVRPHSPSRQWCIPAAVLNGYGPPGVHSDDFAACTRQAVREEIDWTRRIGEQVGSEHLLRRAALIERHLEFLASHSLLAAGELSASV